MRPDYVICGWLTCSSLTTSPHVLTLGQSSLRGLRNIAGAGKSRTSAWHGPAPTPLLFGLMLCAHFPQRLILVAGRQKSLGSSKRADVFCVFPLPGQHWESERASVLAPWQGKKKETIVEGLHCTQFPGSGTLSGGLGSCRAVLGAAAPAYPALPQRAGARTQRLLHCWHGCWQQGWAQGCCACFCAAPGAQSASCTH